MNEADSERLAGALEKLGCQHSPDIEDADVIVLNSCVVRQGVEDKVAGRLNSLKPLKRRDPDKTIALMGCMVGPRDESLKNASPTSTYSSGPRPSTPSSAACPMTMERVWTTSGP